MKKLALLVVAAGLFTGAAFAQDKACCKKKGEKCSKESCCKDKKNCRKDSKETKEKETTTTKK